MLSDKYTNHGIAFVIVMVIGLIGLVTTAFVVLQLNNALFFFWEWSP